jgi:MFS family permease
VLITSNLIFAASLSLMAASPNITTLVAAWLFMGVGMGIGLHDSAFAALTAIYGRVASRPITGITLIAGFASTIGWPFSAYLEVTHGWRVACVGWLVLHIAVALPLNLLLPAGVQAAAGSAVSGEALSLPQKGHSRDMAILAFAFCRDMVHQYGDGRAFAAHVGGGRRHEHRRRRGRSADRAGAGRCEAECALVNGPCL